jgi:hypothetical protein
MDWGKLFEEVLSGSPWALIIILGWWHWRRERINEAELKRRQGVIESLSAQNTKLNREYKETVLEMAGHVETVMDNAKRETLEIQEKRVTETLEMRKEFTTTMTELNTTLQRLEATVQRGGN